jgi:hypothetical protein
MHQSYPAQIISTQIILIQVSSTRKWQAEYQTSSRRIKHLPRASFRKSVDSARTTHRFPRHELKFQCGRQNKKAEGVTAFR